MTESTVSTELKETHAKLCAVAQSANACMSHIKNGISIHIMSESVAFRPLWRFLDAVPKPECVRVGTSGDKLVVSYSPEAPAPSRNKKRGRDDDEVDQRVSKIKSESVTQSLRDDATCIVRGLLAAARGEGGESLVESWGVAVPSRNGGPPLVVSARLSGGVPLSLARIKAALGPRAQGDGMFTTGAVDATYREFQLPRTECGKAADKRGVKSFLVFASLTPAAAPSPASPQKATE
jgi:hypothetical protein